MFAGGIAKVGLVSAGFGGPISHSVAVHDSLVTVTLVCFVRIAGERLEAVSSDGGDPELVRSSVVTRHLVAAGLIFSAAVWKEIGVTNQRRHAERGVAH